MPTPVTLDPVSDALGVIDVQRAFMPGGSLPTPKARAVLAPINRLLRLPFAVRFATQDWHPEGHVSFASSHPGCEPMQTVETEYGPLTLWPDHALQGSREAELHHKLEAERFDVILRKGAKRDREGLSAFSDHGGAVKSGLGAMLRARGVRRLFLAGLALDVCVAGTAKGAVEEGFTTFVVVDASRSSKPKEMRETLADLDRAGVVLIDEHDLQTPPALRE